MRDANQREHAPQAPAGGGPDDRRASVGQTGHATSENSYLVDPASSPRLSKRLSHASLSISIYTAKLRTAH